MLPGPRSLQVLNLLPLLFLLDGQLGRLGLDAVGRRVPLLIGLAVHVLASVLCVFAPNVAVLGVLRVLQGLGGAATAVVATAVVRDMFTGLAAAKVFSRLMLVMGVAPILAPTLGSQVLRWTQWRGVFVLLAVFGVVLVVVAAFRVLHAAMKHHHQRRRLALVIA